MKKTLKLSEAELTSIIKKVIKENKFDRRGDLKNIIDSLEDHLGFPMETRFNDSSDVVSHAEKMLKSLQKEISTLKDYEVELRAALFGIGVSTKEMKGYGEDTKEF